MPPDGIAKELDAALSALQRATMAFADVEVDSGQTLQLALHQLIEVTGADAGAVAIPGESGAQAILLAEHCLLSAGSVIRSLLHAVLEETSGQAVINEPTATQRASDSGITSILCTPVRRRGKTLAAVYLDRRDKPGFDEVDLRLATSFASVLGLAFDLTRQREWAEQSADEARAIAVHTSDFWRFGTLVTRNRRFADCLQLAERAAASDASVLLQGESGVGKEHLARCIHAESTRRDRIFVVVNCAANPSESEFDLVREQQRAPTGSPALGGAHPNRGKAELGPVGTLLLAEIGALSLQLQERLLRALDRRTVPSAQGGPRIMATSRKDLLEEVRAGRFRKDLLLSLNVVTVNVPTLRQRVEDVPGLARGFLQLHAQRSGRRLSLTDEALRALARYSWPGNVAELQNVMEKLCVLSDGSEIGVTEVQLHLGADGAGAAEPPSREASKRLSVRIEEAEQAIRELRGTLGANGLDGPRDESPEPAEADRTQATSPEEKQTGRRGFREQMDDAARAILARTIREEGSISAAALALGVSRQQVYLKCKRLGLKDF